VREEDEVGERDEDQLLDERPLERVGGAVDELRAVVEGHDAHALGEPRLQLFKLALDRLDDFEDVDAVARHDHAAHRLGAVLVERAGAEGVAELHRRDVTDVDGGAVLRREDDVLQVGRRLDQTQPAHDRPLPGLLDDVPADVLVRAPDGLDHGRERQPVGAQAVRVDVDLILLDVAADRRHLGHARHRVQLVADEPVLQRAQVA
jgi:hypothetical protein